VESLGAAEILLCRIHRKAEIQPYNLTSPLENNVGIPPHTAAHIEDHLATNVLSCPAGLFDEGSFGEALSISIQLRRAMHSPFVAKVAGIFITPHEAGDAIMDWIALLTLWTHEAEYFASRRITDSVQNQTCPILRTA